MNVFDFVLVIGQSAVAAMLHGHRGSLIFGSPMYGPERAGKWSSLVAADSGSQHQFLKAGERYRVTREFIDYDKGVHRVGDEWVFLGCSFLPHDSGMSFFVSLDDLREWHIRLQWIPEEQGEMLDNLDHYVTIVRRQ